MLNESKLPADGFVRLKTILQIIPVGRSTFWAGVASGRYPKPVRHGRRITMWRVEDIRQLLQRLNEEAP